MSHYLIINADDFGYSRAVNFGIIDSYKMGVLSSTTLMANMPGFNHAVRLSKSNPGLGVGVHLALTCGRPLLSENKSLVEENGDFKNISFYESDFSISQDELYTEWEAQIKKVIDSGIEPTHLDSHHHINRLEGISDVFIELARKYHLPVRNNMQIPSDIRTTVRFFLGFDNLSFDRDIWKSMYKKNLIEDCLNYSSVEAMCHPGYIDNHLVNHSKLTLNRTRTVEELLDPSYEKLFKDNDIKLVTYRELAHRKELE
jgi:hypothetical protein